MSNPTPPEVTPPAGHEILTPEFASHKVGDSVQFFPSGSDVPYYGTIQSIDDHGMAIVHSGDLDFVRDLCALSRPIQWHNPDNLDSAGEPPWRFLVEGEDAETGDEGWDKWIKGQWSPTVFDYPMLPGKDHTFRTRRPLSQKGGDELIGAGLFHRQCPHCEWQGEYAQAHAPVFLCPSCKQAAQMTFCLPNPDARPWLPIAEYDREKHGEWVEGRWLAPSLHQGVRKIHWNTHHRRWQDEHEFVYFNGVPTHFRLPAPSVPTSGTPRTDIFANLPMRDRDGISARLRDFDAAVATFERWADFARTLERELASATAERDEAKEANEQYAHIVGGLRSRATVLQEKLTEADKQLLAAQTRTDVAEREGGEVRRNAVLDFAEQVLHGDQEHRNWLGAAAVAFVHGQPLPEPNGKGRAEAAEAQRDLALRELAELKAKIGEKV